MERNIRVAVRVRPFNTRELESNQKNIIRVLDNQNILFDPEDDVDEFFFHGAKIKHRDITRRVNKKLTMDFDSVFDMESENQTVYEGCMKPLVGSVMDGYNSSIFVYGATGAGKTHTMLGNVEEPGIVLLTVRELFRHMESLADQRHFDIGVSYLEVYNELVMNLLTKSGPLKLRENAHGVEVGGLTLQKINNSEELINMLTLGNKNRTQHPTDANAESSRSHAIFQVHIRIVDRKTNQKKTVKLSMIDLAGSERAASTKCMGLRFKEGANINKSLLALGNCINKLADGSKHVPYRDSNLTRILKDSLGGNCQTLMIANISPSSLTYEDTYNTLKYASSAKKIRTVCRQNIVANNMPKEYYLKKATNLEEENFKLKELLRLRTAEIEDLKLKLAAAAEKKQEAVITTVTVPQEDLSVWQQRLTDVYDKMRKNREKYWLMKSKEKILMLKIKFKEQLMDVRRKIYFDGSLLDMELAKLHASTDKFSKQINSQHEYLTLCRENLNVSFQELNGLLAEIREAQLEPKLELFIASKEYEMEAFFGKIAREHCNKLNALFKTEHEHTHDALILSCDLLQQEYLLLRGNNIEIDMDTNAQQEQLLKLIHKKNGIRFQDENLQDTLSQMANLSKETDLSSPECPASLPTSVRSGFASKRRQLFDREEPKEASDEKVQRLASHTNKRGNLNETTVVVAAVKPMTTMPFMEEGVKELAATTVDPLNSTFQMPPKPQGNPIANLVTKNVLTEHNLNKIISQPALMTKIGKGAAGARSNTASASRENLNRIIKKGMQENGGGGTRFSPNRRAKTNATLRGGVHRSKPTTTAGGGGGGGNGMASGSANKRWK